MRAYQEVKTPIGKGVVIGRVEGAGEEYQTHEVYLVAFKTADVGGIAGTLAITGNCFHLEIPKECIDDRPCRARQKSRPGAG